MISMEVFDSFMYSSFHHSHHFLFVNPSLTLTIDKVTTAPVASTQDASAGSKKKKTGNMWTRSKNFKKLTDWAFKTIDADGSGQVDKKELYTGLLMIHLKLATYAGPAACRPATREYCEKIFDQMDVDKSGELDREEFTEVMQIVCAQVFTRVTIQWTMTLMIVPMSKLFVGLDQLILLWLSRPILFSHVAPHI